jgi:hypothetical protein
MSATGKFRRDRMIAATVALVVNGLIAWELRDLLVPTRTTMDEASDALQVVWIAPPPPRPDIASAIALRRPATKNRSALPIAPPVAAPAPLEVSPSTQSVVPTPSRSMAAVYLQQARRWAADRPLPTGPKDPFANRPVALARQAKSRFRLARPISPADVVASVGVLFGGSGYTTDDCGAIDERLLGLVVAGDDQAVQQDLDYERRNCRR